MGLDVRVNNNIPAVLQKIMERIGSPLAQELNRETLYFIGRIQNEQMSGRHGNIGLNVDTGNLRRSWFMKTSRESGGFVTSAYTSVKYAAIHQYGGTVHIPARESVLSFGGRRGRFVSPSKKAFINGAKGQRQQKVHIRGHDIHIPKRLFVIEAFEKEMPARYLAAVQKVITGK